MLIRYAKHLLRAAILTLLVGAQAIAAPPGVGDRVARANAGTVGVVSGGIAGTYIRIAADLSAVLDDGDELRVLPILGKGSLQNLADVLYLRGVDIGIVQSDVLAYARRQHLFPGIEQSVQYIAKLYDEELHVLAGPKVSKLEDLNGQKVNVDVPGSGTAMTASVVFESFGLTPEMTHYDQDAALEKLKSGEIAAMVYVAGKPARVFTSAAQQASGLHFLPVPLTPALLETYLPAHLSHADYPLIPEGDGIDTVAVGSVMAVYAWPEGSERYRKVARFVDAFFSKFPEFLLPPRHPKWRDVNLSAQVPGWTRFAPAQAWLARQNVAQRETNQGQFEAFLSRVGGPAAQLPDRDKQALFQEFLRWQARQHASQ